MKPKTKERVLFNQFLKENGITKEFVFNFKNHRASRQVPIKEFLNPKYNNYESIITNSFVWVATDQKYSYWSDIDRKWRKYLNQHNN